MKAILVGAGFWGSGWGRVLNDSPDTELAAIVDSDRGRLDIAADAVSLPADRRYTDIEAALAGTEADMALIVVPPEAHVPVARACLEAGLHCLVEKPLAPSLAEGREITDLAERLDRKMMICQSFRFKRGPQTVRKLVSEGLLGPIELVNVHFSKAPPFDSGFRVEMEEPVIIDQAIHHFDYMRGILGLEPTRVRARSFNPSWSWYAGNSVVSVELETAEGAHIFYTASWVSRAAETTWDGDWDIQGPGGAITWAHNRVEYRPVDFGETVFTKDMLELGGGVMEVPLVNLEAEEREGTLREFTTAISEGRQPEPGGEDNLRSLAIVYGAVESVRTGDWVDVDPQSDLGVNI